MARPSSYKPEFAEQARKLALMGATDKDLAAFFEVTERTINRWKKDYPEFCQSLTRGKVLADAEVAASLYERAVGFRHPDVSIHVVGGKIRKVKVERVYPPEVKAADLWLRNRRPDLWRRDPDPKDTDDDPTPVRVVVQVTDARKPDAEPEQTTS
ncbi:terminase [Cupriavidus gilardii]|uniref:terminase n=1 Tax=Cupriavidus gilardii TaxID=82541 RepID=UPI001ABDAF55|nr:terminase [Cupriavidus gilardii]MBO4120273.1 terminase [Cupriavidus gilardii]